MPRASSPSDIFFKRPPKGMLGSSGTGGRAARASHTSSQPAKAKASSTTPSRSGAVSHSSLPPARKEGRAKEQGNPLALGPPVGKKTKFLSLAVEAERPTATLDTRLVASRTDDGDPVSPSTDPRSGVIAVLRPANVVSKEPLSKRRARAEATKSMPVLLPVGSSKAARSQTAFDAAFSLRPDERDEQSPAPKKSAKKARSANDLPIAAIATLLAEQAGSSAGAQPVAPTADHPKAHKTRLNESQRARAKKIRDGWVNAEGLSAKAANSRWVDILSAAGWNGDVALLVAKHFAAAGGVQKARNERRTDSFDDDDGLCSFRFSPVVGSETDADGQSSASAPTSSTTPSAGDTAPSLSGAVPLESRKRRRRSSSVSSSAGRPAFFNPFLALAHESPPAALTPEEGPETFAASSAVKDDSAAAAAAQGESVPTSSTVVPELPADDRSISTTAIRIVQRLAGSELAPEILLDLVDLFHSDGQAAEVFLSLRDDMLKTLWIRRQAKKLVLA